MRYGAEVIPVCPDCAEKEGKLKSCKKCGVEYCKEYASKTDVRFCGNCMSDFHVVESVFEKRVEYKDENNNTRHSRSYVAKRYSMQGNDWLFTAAAVDSMSDHDLEETIEYHRANVSIMLHEREQRKMEQYKKFAGIKVEIPKDRKSQADLDKEREKADKKKKLKAPAQMDANALIELLKKGGFTAEQLKVALGG